LQFGILEWIYADRKGDYLLAGSDRTQWSLGLCALEADGKGSPWENIKAYGTENLCGFRKF